jgi:ArsR family transcriptional regulator, arsenate/arsenite/antimonite-responsive transcriptional repressor
MADIYEAIADATRRQLLEVLLGAQLVGGPGELTVSELVAATGLGQPTVSKHLKTLREVGLVSAREEGQKRFYTVTPEPLEEIEDWMVNFLSLNFDPEAEAEGQGDEFVAALSTAGERLGRWLTDSAAWVGSKVKERVDLEDVDPKELGRKLGRKLAEAKVDTEKSAKEFEKNARSKIEEVIDEVKTESKHFAEEAKTKAEELKSKAEELKSDVKAKAKEVKSDVKAKATEVKADVKAKATEVTADVKAKATEVTADVKAKAEEVKADVKSKVKKL